MCHSQLFLCQMVPNYGQALVEVLKPGKVGGPHCLSALRAFSA